MKKIIYIFMIIMLFTGCSSKPITVEKSNGDSKAYLFLKDKYNPDKYYFEFYDRNISSNDKAKIIMARDDNKYYYSINGDNDIAIIQKDGFKYTVDFKLKSYSKVLEKNIMDNSFGILPRNMEEFKTLGYIKGKERIFNQSLEYEKYDYGNIETTYYFKGKNLVYIKCKQPTKTITLKYINYKKKVSDKLFDVPKKYVEMTY